MNFLYYYFFFTARGRDLCWKITIILWIFLASIVVLNLIFKFQIKQKIKILFLKRVQATNCNNPQLACLMWNFPRWNNRQRDFNGTHSHICGELKVSVLWIYYFYTGVCRMRKTLFSLISSFHSKEREFSINTLAAATANTNILASVIGQFSLSRCFRRIYYTHTHTQEQMLTVNSWPRIAVCFLVFLGLYIYTIRAPGVDPTGHTI